jgi:uncharacterized protein YwqG
LSGELGPTFERDRAVIEHALRATALSEIGEAVRSVAAPSLRLHRADDAAGRSRIGGEPLLPAGAEWPRWNGRPLGFLAQLDLAELPQLPTDTMSVRDGLLAFFFDLDEDRPWGHEPSDAGSGVVIWTPPDAEVADRPIPEGVPTENRPRFSGIRPDVELTVPDVESGFGGSLQLDGAVRDAYYDLLIALEGLREQPVHRFLGHPEQIQNDMQRQAQLASHGISGGGDELGERAELLERAGDWRLLLQFDSEFEEPEVMWADAGRVYFWIREQDLSAGRFDATWTILQC